jgi:hypothetical protein
MLPALNGQLVRAPNTGTAAITGNVPTVARTINVLLTPSTGGASFAGSSPVQFTPQNIVPSSGAVGFAGLGASVAQFNTSQVPTGTLAIASDPPDVTLKVFSRPQVGTGAAGFSSDPPVLAQTVSVVSGTQSGALSFGSDPVIVAQQISGGVFADFNIVRTTPNTWPYQKRPQPYGEFFYSVGDIERFGIDFSGMLANRWVASNIATLGTTIRPIISQHGLQAVCTQTGQTGSIEPRWPTSAGASVYDGSAIWTMDAVNALSLEGELQNASWTAPAGLDLQFNATQDQTALITIDATNAVAGTDYDVICTAQFSGATPQVVGKIRVKVR